jgi:hypothetical protein
VVIEAKPIGMLWMTPAGRPDHLLRMARRAQKDLPESRLVARMNKFTLLDDAVRGFGGAAAEGWVSETDRQRQLTGMHDADGERRHLFGTGEGPTEAVAEAKQVSRGVERIQFVKKFVSEQWILSCKSLGRPLVYHL